nr:hypothetical protein Q903MT_gene4919 [Picea sitchensis]
MSSGHKPSHGPSVVPSFYVSLTHPTLQTQKLFPLLFLSVPSSFFHTRIDTIYAIYSMG